MSRPQNTKHPHNQRTDSHHPTSPWTEAYQATSAWSDTTDDRKASYDENRSDTYGPTHDALSDIYNRD